MTAGLGEIAKAAGVKRDVVVDVFEAIFQLVRDGEVVRVTGFGTFERKSFPGRTVQSPAINEGEPVTFGDVYRLAFKQSRQAKRRLNIRLKTQGKSKATAPSKSATKKKAKRSKKDKG